MGVMATFCQICGLPVQHDHFFPSGSMWGIYRGDGKEGDKSSVSFSPEHEWLKDAVGLRLDDSQSPAILRGPVHDGIIEADGPGRLVLDGVDERAALHAICYELAGSPSRWAPVGAIPVIDEIVRHQEQLFDFEGLLAEGAGWLLVDPRLPSDEGQKNRGRIQTAVDYYLGNRKSPDLMALLKFLSDQQGTVLELRPNEPPVFRKGNDILPHSFHALPAKTCEAYLLATLTPEKREQLAQDQAVKTVFSIKNMGAFSLEVRVVNGQLAGSFQLPIPPMKL